MRTVLYRIMVFVAVIELVAGCSQPPISSKLVVPSIPAPKTVGSLWQEENGRAYLYEDMRAMPIISSAAWMALELIS